ncbi:polysaccharide biosynthesis C-terminal domain-containing protein [Vibrio parahaemolyticus]|uniref:lipopolysaccharide biosynthesis protein n=1 Tax=Vibrio parahaemolyticus TaxID=670 RepID=UPI00064ADC35|nr:polysaccharide biosynthesis C-terminal domain-containing protein [Vibrio parahaemolyticus]EJG1473124.1 polysaccharide biosynthesis C-terminal domain-containing protein [Vibrio parahaemolyticus]EKA7405796.1 polysaccharide biosynthesis C-terminal domain-containing protein [Vibrio parahaemolyticus]EKG9657751.1 polysaccharide biosynthesis C-terminal domain-containing protein [Vibrio parahaemolyticus]EKL9847736.1 polysaccharide biosynthesis C-terminal domain-containing protein [Vibrio parahaemoly
MKSFFKDSAISIIIKITSVLIGFFTTILLTNNTDIETFGEYSYWIAVISLLALPMQVGFPTVFVRESAKGNYSAVFDKYKRFISLFFILLFFVCLPIFISGMNNIGFSILIAFLVSISVSLSGAIRGNGGYLLGQMPDSIFRQLFFFLIISVSLILEGGVNTSGLLFRSLISSALCVLITVYVLSLYTKKIKYSESNQEINIKPALIYFSLLSGVQVLDGQLNVFILSVFGSDEDIALYKVALQVSILVSFGLHSVTMLSAPMFSKLYYSNDIENLIRILDKTVIMSLMVSLPSFLIVVFMGNDLLTIIFGDEYLGSYSVLLILSLGQLFISLFGPQVTLLNSCGLEKDVFVVTSISLIIGFLAALILVQYFSIEGVAIATLLSQALRVLILSMRVKKRLSVNYGVGRLVPL